MNYPKAYLYRRIVQAKLFIDSQYASNVDLDNISGEALFSKFHFIREFKRIYGETPHQYLIKVRIQQAISLLEKGSPVSDACYAVGFESLPSFSKLFKKNMGLSPSAYFLQQQKRTSQLASVPLQFIPGCFAEKKGWKNKKAILNKRN